MKLKFMCAESPGPEQDSAKGEIVEYDLDGTGSVGVIWGAHVITSRLLPVGDKYVCCEPVMGIDKN